MQLEKADWFSRVGIKDTDAAIVLSSWQEAVEHCGSPEWEDLSLEASNRYCEELLKRSKERFSTWNDVVAEPKPVTIPFVRRKIEAVVRQHSLPEIFEGMVQWDVLHVCLEAEYADVILPGYYASQAYWYTKGHFPCGWKGKFPEGKLIIY